MNTKGMIYVAYAHCGCSYAYIVNDTKDPEWTTRRVGEMRQSKTAKEVRLLTQEEWDAEKTKPGFCVHHPHGYKDPAKCPLRQDPTPDMFATLAD